MGKTSIQMVQEMDREVTKVKNWKAETPENFYVVGETSKVSQVTRNKVKSLEAPEWYYHCAYPWSIKE